MKVTKKTGLFKSAFKKLLLQKIAFFAHVEAQAFLKTETENVRQKSFESSKVS